MIPFALVVIDEFLEGLCVSNWEFSLRNPDSATLRGARRLTYADPHMRDLLSALLHLAVVTAKLCGSGGVRAVMAESRHVNHRGSLQHEGDNRLFGLVGRVVGQ